MHKSGIELQGGFTSLGILISHCSHDTKLTDLFDSRFLFLGGKGGGGSRFKMLACSFSPVCCSSLMWSKTVAAVAK